MEESGTGFRKELVSKLLHLHFKDDKTKVSGDALQLTAELLKVFVVGERRARQGPRGPVLLAQTTVIPLHCGVWWGNQGTLPLSHKHPSSVSLESGVSGPTPVLSCQLARGWGSSGPKAQGLGFGRRCSPVSCRSGRPQRPAGPGGGPDPRGCGPAGEGAASAAPGLLRLSTSPWLPACVTAKPRVHVSCGFYFQKGQELLPPGSPPLRRQASVPAKRPSPCHALPGCGRWGTEWEPGP